MRQTPRLVVTKDYASLTIKIAVYDASVTTAIQENLVVSSELFYHKLFDGA